MLDASTGARSGAGRQGVAGTGRRKPEHGAGWWVGWQGPRAQGASVLGLHPGSMHPQGANRAPLAWAALVCSPGALGDYNCANKMARKSKKSVCSLSFVPWWPRSWCPRRQDVRRAAWLSQLGSGDGTGLTPREVPGLGTYGPCGIGAMSLPERSLTHASSRLCCQSGRQTRVGVHMLQPSRASTAP